MSFWRQLAQERELRGVSLEEVAERTKISRSTLERMESGAPDHLPARVYLVGYLRSYADAVGLDADDVLLRFEEAGLEDGSVPSKGEGTDAEGDTEASAPAMGKGPLPWIAWGTVGILAILAVLYWTLAN